MNVYLHTDEWLPWSNTVWYYPLTATSTVNDMSWNNNTLTNNGSVTFWTNAWVSSGSFTWASTYLSLGKALFTWNSSFTVSIWFYNVPNSSYLVNMIWWVGNNSQQNWIVFYKNDDWKIMYWYWWTNQSTWVNCPTNSWHLLTVTYNWTSIKTYLDWTLINTGSVSLNLTNTRTVIGASLNTTPTSKWCWYLSEAIFENRVWTAEQVTWYYNQTKSLYWIS